MGRLTTLMSSKNYLIQDGFNRADNASLGKADTGQTWQYYGQFGISQGKAICSANNTGPEAKAYISTGRTDYAFTCDLIWGGTAGCNVGILGRWDTVTVGNFYYVGINPNGQTIDFYKNSGGGGTWTLVGQYTLNAVAGVPYTLKVTFKGSSIKVYLSGALILTATDSSFSGQYIAIRNGGIDLNGKWDNVLVEAI